ncbi:MAG: hypothetical protein EXQ88_07720 [Alphaproteobacteria bacterium]|nr:hypothetical protein [Alphaproteobacteria bacterium]
MVAALGLYGDALRIGHGSMGGWDVFGPERMVSSSAGNILFALDGAPALDLYKKYLGEHARELPGSALLFPLTVWAPGQPEQALVRTIVGIDEQLPDGGWIVIISDIPLRKRADEEQVAARLAAEAANMAKSQFLANMSHELRTPLNAIIGFSELMERSTFGPIGDARYAEYVSDIHRSGMHLLSVINDILDMAKVEAGREELTEDLCAIGELVNDAIAMVRERAKLGQVTINQALSPSLGKVIVDRHKMIQVLVNLLSNAVKFTRAGGRITLTAWTGRNGCVIQVEDTGIGMQLEEIPRAFMAFTQLDSGLNRKHEGTGLGLPLCKALIELHGGSIDLQSTPAVGTIATLRLPKSRILGDQPNSLSVVG